MVPYLLAAAFGANLFLLQESFYRLVFLVQILFYALATAEALREKASGAAGKGPGYVPYVFCLLNFSALMGFVQFLRKKQKAAWEKAYA